MVETTHLCNRRKRLLYQAWHRGTREMDFLLGRYVEAHIHTLTDETLATFESLLEISDPELYQLIINASLLQHDQNLTPQFKQLLLQIRNHA